MNESIYDFAFCMMLSDQEILKRYCFLEGRIKSEEEQKTSEQVFDDKPDSPKKVNYALTDD